MELRKLGLGVIAQGRLDRSEAVGVCVASAPTMMTRLPVALGERSYDILIGPRLLEAASQWLQPLKLGSRGAIVADENVASLYGGKLQKALDRDKLETALITVPPGEKSKSLDEVSSLYERLLEARLDRKSFLIALGGGVVGDLTGFVASTFLRGIAYVQVPTTLLAQVDSSVGGKVGVNLPRGKNLVGSFYQPRLVLADLDTLQTLPEREYRAGLAEVIKYGIIYDADFFAVLERETSRVRKKDLALLEKIVARCCEIKAEVVSKDEREDGLRAILNFGHTIGHAIEASHEYSQFLHGEAIAMGMVCAARLSQRHGHLSKDQADRIERVFRTYGFETSLEKPNFNRLLAAMRLDKKAQQGKIRFVLAGEIGRAFVSDEVTEADLREVLGE